MKSAEVATSVACVPHSIGLSAGRLRRTLLLYQNLSSHLIGVHVARSVRKHSHMNADSTDCQGQVV